MVWFKNKIYKNNGFGKSYFFCKKMQKNAKKNQKKIKKRKKCDFWIFGFSVKNRTFWDKIGLFGPFLGEF